jgi:hypothetical protein
MHPNIGLPVKINKNTGTFVEQKKVEKVNPTTGKISYEMLYTGDDILTGGRKTRKQRRKSKKSRKQRRKSRKSQ